MPDLLPVDITLDPKISIHSVLSRLNEAINNTGLMSIELFKCYSTKSMMKRPAEFPVDPESERSLFGLLEWCKEGPKTVYYTWRTEARAQRAGSGPRSPAPVMASLSPEDTEAEDAAKESVSLSVEEDIMDTA